MEANKTQQPPSVVNPHLSSITGVLDVTKIFTQSQESFINMSEPEAISPSDAEMSDKSTGKTVSDASDAADASFAPSTPTMMVDEVAVSVNEITDPSVAYSSSGGQNEVDYSPPFDYIIVFTPKKTNKQFFHQMLTFDAAEMDADRLMSRMRSSSNLRNTFVSILRLAGLNVKQSEYRQGGLLVIKLGASEDTLMRLAEETQLPKRTLDGWWEPYSVMNADSFELTKFNTRFHARERQHLILHAIYSSKLFSHDERSTYRMERIISRVVPIHHRTELSQFYHRWLKAPTLRHHAKYLDHVRDYFGEEVSFYFAFMLCYTAWLLPLGLVGLVLHLFRLFKISTAQPIFDLLVMVWMSAFLEVWRRKERIYAHRWGTINDSDDANKIRPQFDAPVVLNPNTGQYERSFPPYKRRLRQYLISYPIQAAILLVILVLLYFAINTGALLALVPYLRVVAWIMSPLFYGIFIPLLRAVYRRVAIAMNQFENHRTIANFELSLAWKLFTVHFITVNVPIFYTAFVLKSDSELRALILGSFIISQFSGLFAEIFMPFWKKITAFVHSRIAIRSPNIIADIRPNLVQQFFSWVWFRSDDMVDMANQIGAISLLSHSFPLASMLAFINNFFEIKSDMFKLARLCQRPRAMSSSSIHPWLTILVALSFVAVTTNAIYISISDSRWMASFEMSTRIAIGIIIEHIGFVLKVLFMAITPTTPRRIAKRLEENRLRANARGPGSPARSIAQSQQDFMAMLSPGGEPILNSAAIDIDEVGELTDSD